MTAISVLQSLLLESVPSGGSSFRRGLQNTNGTSSNGANGAPDSSPDDAYEFIAFLLWYIFLVLCCIVPTCCAYRRRRLVELQLAQQHANLHRMQRNDLFILSNLEHNSQIRRQNPERVQQERLRILTDELEGTTMVRYTYSISAIATDLELTGGL
jgi:hypothetical protein